MTTSSTPVLPQFNQPLPQTIADLTRDIQNQIDTNGFDGYAALVLAFIGQCASQAAQKYDPDLPAPPYAVNVRDPMDAYYFEVMGPYPYMQYRPIRLEKQPSGPIAARTADDLFAMCNQIDSAGRTALANFEIALNKPAWGPTATII